MLVTIVLFLVTIVLFLVFLSIFARLTRGITKSSACLVGKTAIVTGANSGVGYQTALNLASRGCKVIMADVAGMEKSKNDIIKHTNNSNIIAKKLDLSSLQSIRAFANEVKKNETRLDILVNNAGISNCNSATIDGLNAVMQVNYFGHFLLTHLLIDLLKKSSPARIIFTSSILSFFNNLTVKNLNTSLDNPQTFRNQLQVYNNSKFALIVASGIFAKKLQSAGVTSNCVHPGLVPTSINLSLINETNIFMKTVVKLLFLMFAKDSWAGSQSIVHVAVSKKLDQVTGGFFVDCLQFWTPGGREDEFAKIWRASEEFVKLSSEEKL